MSSLGRLAWLLMGSFSVAVAEDRGGPSLMPGKVELQAERCGEGWQKWSSIGNLEGAVTHRERITALAAHENDAWVGTSYGRMLTRRGDDWILQGQLNGIQITGIAVENENNVWLSTSDGIRRLDREVQQPWKVSEFRHYYEGHPTFVSGGYIPGEDAERLWGYVDGIYFPRRDTAYSPLVVSTEHGLFCWGNYGTVWHHFLPHFWGANSPWLDTRELVPHRRPTCIVEDNDSNLWIGTQWDGIVRLNAHGRKYHTREPENNKKDGTEFSFVRAELVGRSFDSVIALASSSDKGIWAILASGEKNFFLARFDGQRWETFPLENGGQSVAEIRPGAVFVGQQKGICRLDWSTNSVEPQDGPEQTIREIVTANGRVFAASWWDLYERLAE